MAKNIEAKKGFTIIEVVLVLAIAGLIFLMVFVAFPALQRSQNDTRRQSDISRLSTQITNFKTNNSNAIPGKDAKNDNGTVTITGASIDTNANVGKRGTWAYFYKNYLLTNGDIFKDPDGDSYNLDIVYCSKDGTAAKPMSGLADGTDCYEGAAQSGGTDQSGETSGETTQSGKTAQRYNTTFADQDHTILVVLGARCDGEAAVAASGARNMALVYKREGGGTICIAN